MDHQPDAQASQESTIDQFQAALGRMGAGVGSQKEQDFAAELCLASRSAYFDYFVKVTVSGEKHAQGEEQLDQLFRQSIGVMREGDFRAAVRARYEDFLAFCGGESVSA